MNGGKYKTGCKLLSKAQGRAALGIAVQQKHVTIHQVINDDLRLGRLGLSLVSREVEREEHGHGRRGAMEVSRVMCEVPRRMEMENWTCYYLLCREAWTWQLRFFFLTQVSGAMEVSGG